MITEMAVGVKRLQRALISLVRATSRTLESILSGEVAESTVHEPLLVFCEDCITKSIALANTARLLLILFNIWRLPLV